MQDLVVCLEGELNNSKKIIYDLKNKVTVYLPVKDDPLDCKLAE
jgi:hypothetical protein